LLLTSNDAGGSCDGNSYGYTHPSGSAYSSSDGNRNSRRNRCAAGSSDDNGGSAGICDATGKHGHGNGERRDSACIRGHDRDECGLADVHESHLYGSRGDHESHDHGV